MTAYHECPGPGEVHSQGNRIPADMLACSRHWYQVPRPLRNRVWATWRDGEGAGSPEHIRAMADAIATMTELAPPKPRAARRRCTCEGGRAWGCRVHDPLLGGPLR
jgi:hypothetical protein